MSRRACVWWNRQKRTWCTEIGGQRHTLAKGKRNRRLAERLFRSLLDEQRLLADVNGAVTVAALCDLFLEDAKQNLEQSTCHGRNVARLSRTGFWTAQPPRLYAQAIRQFFDWCEARGVTKLDRIQPVVIAGYIEHHAGSAPTVKQHLAAIRMLFDWLVTGHVVPHNPATSVRGPKHVVKRGKTPVLTADEARKLLDSIDITTLIGLRDRALIGVMIYSFARVSATVTMKVDDFYAEGKRWWLRLHEKGGKRHEVPAHHNADEYLDAYLKAAEIADEKKSPLFRTIDRSGRITDRGMTRNDALRMVKRLAAAAGLSAKTSCHSFRATGITAYLENGGTIENAQAIAAHESPRTTKLYDRTSDEITLDEIERIAI